MNEKVKKAKEAFYKMARDVNSTLTLSAMENLFDSLSDEEFDKMMKKLKDKKTILPMVEEPNSTMDESKLIKLIEDMGELVEQKLITEDGEYGDSMPDTTTIVVDVPIKRAAQTIDKKISVSIGDKTSPYSGQVTGDSKASSFTVQEMQLLQGYGLDNIIKEFRGPRGGDQGAKRAMTRELFEKGSTSLKEINPERTGVQSKKVVKAYWLASHLESTL